MPKLYPPEFIYSRLFVFHVEILPLKVVAYANILLISVTLLVFQALRGWLKEVAARNISLISVTLLVFHALRG